MGEMKRREAWESAERAREEKTGQRYISTLAICASIIAGIRLVKEPIEKSPKVISTVGESISLAREVLDMVLRRYPDSSLK